MKELARLLEEMIGESEVVAVEAAAPVAEDALHDHHGK